MTKIIDIGAADALALVHESGELIDVAAMPVLNDGPKSGGSMAPRNRVGIRIQTSRSMRSSGLRYESDNVAGLSKKFWLIELRDRQIHDLMKSIGAVERRPRLAFCRPSLEPPWRISENRVELLAGNSEIVEVFYPAAILGARGVRGHPAGALAHLQDAARDALDIGAGPSLDLGEQPLELGLGEFGKALRPRGKMLVDAEIAQEHPL